MSADVKSQIQALDRTQPMLPVTFGRKETRTHDYKRNGTSDMYAGHGPGKFDVYARMNS